MLLVVAAAEGKVKVMELRDEVSERERTKV